MTNMHSRHRPRARAIGRTTGTSRPGVVLLTLFAAIVLAVTACGNSSTSARRSDAAKSGPTTTLPPVPAALASKLARECTNFAMQVSTTDAVLDPVAKVAALRPVVAKLRADLGHLTYPPMMSDVRAKVDGAMADAARRLAAAKTTRAASSAFTEFQHDIDTAGLTLLRAGVNCLGNAAALDRAQTTVQLEGDSWLIASGFGSLWVSEKYLGRVVRLSSTGEVLARIDVGPNPAKVFASDRWVWVRTQTGLVRIDPDTNRVSRSAPYTMFGAATQRAWAAGDQLWLCDGGTLLRIDQSLLQVVARIPLHFACFEVFTDGVTAIAWSSDNAPDESGNEQIAIIDPATNRVKATVAMPVDIGIPAIVGHRAYFAGDNNDRLIAVDTNSGAIVATMHLGFKAAGFGIAGDDSVWVPTDGFHVLRVDPNLFTLRPGIDPVGAAGVAILGHSLWTVTFDPLNIAQRFDIDAKK